MSGWIIIVNRSFGYPSTVRHARPRRHRWPPRIPRIPCPALMPPPVPRAEAGPRVQPKKGEKDMTTTNPIDEARLEAFVGQAVTDMGAAISGLLLHIGDRLGLYKAMAGAGPITSATLAARTGTGERYVREWLGNQAAGGYVTYDPADGTYELPAEQAMVVANEDSPVFLGGAFEAIASCYADHDVFIDAFRTGAGVGWHAHDDRLFSGVDRLFRPTYATHLVAQ